MSDSWNPRTVARQAYLSKGFLWQKCCRGLPFLSPGGLPDPGKEQGYCRQILYQVGHHGSPHASLVLLYLLLVLPSTRNIIINTNGYHNDVSQMLFRV